MQQIYLVIYRIAVELYYYAALIGSFFNRKIQLWLAGQRQTWLQLYKAKPIAPQAQGVLWVHCASLGEFEQGRSLIEQLKVAKPNLYVVLSFFSPSGYEVRKNYPLANEVHYLLHDSPENARLWLDKLQPNVAIFIKYEYWYYYIAELRQRQIPLIVVSALFRPNQVFFRPYGAFFRHILSLIPTIFVQNSASAQLLLQHGITQGIVAPDTRFDAVAQNAQQRPSLPLISRFCQQHTVAVAGSTWQADEQLLAELINQTDTDLQHIRWIIAPHEVGENRLLYIEQLLKVRSLRYSDALLINGKLPTDVRVLLIDNIGMLAHLYAYARYAYIGGGFRNGIHNCLEAAVFGVPLFWGTNYGKFQEAKDLIALQAAQSVRTSYQLASYLLNWEQHPAEYQRIAAATRHYVQQNTGGTARILPYILRHLPN